ncbi:hypothetical protein DFH27DRAFT_521891 [Peziza echinospora]|nr:hypothetical protein DFH27DRAFT_521891 [Peziza echinospora]
MQSYLHQTAEHASKRRNLSPGPSTRCSSCAPPPPPAHTQACLLNVGMRVRKAVSSGYKTKNTSFPSYQAPGAILEDTNYPELPTTTNTINVINEIDKFLNSDVDEGFYSTPNSQESKKSKRPHEAQTEDFPLNVPAKTISAFDVIMANRQPIIMPKSQIQKKSKRREYFAGIVTSNDKGVSNTSSGVVVTHQPADDFAEALFLKSPEELDDMEIDDDLMLTL